MEPEAVTQGETDSKEQEEGKRQALIDQILGMQQELQALDERSQKLEYETHFSRSSSGNFSKISST